MDTFVSYLIKSVSVSGLLLIYYLLVLRNRRLHSFNRLYLLGILLASLVLPLIRLHWHPFHGTESQPLDVLIARIAPHHTAQPALSVTLMVLGGYIGISVVLLVVLTGKIIRLYRLKKRHSSRRMTGYDLIEINDPQAPFSFLNHIFWRQGADTEDPVNKKILAHELAHIRGRHTYDNLFTHLLACLFWINPFYWLVRRELSMIHEFIADSSCVADGDTESFATMLLHAYDEGRYLDPSHSFFHSPIKRRLVMITSSNHSSRHLLRKALVLPALLTVMILSCSKEQGAVPANQPSVALKKKLDALQIKNLVLTKLSFKIKDGSLKTVNIMIDTSRAQIGEDHALKGYLISSDGKPDVN
jgi:beta-lactamase regulating signal transducer with metallopeptidase domain